MRPVRRSFSGIAMAFLAGVALVAIHAVPALAQGGSGAISGTAKDPSGLVVPGVSVLVRNTDTGIERTVTTNPSGIYLAEFLQPGKYEVSADKQGFAKLLRQDLTLQVGQTLTVDLAFHVQAAQETVTVNEETPLIEPEKTDVSQVVSQTLTEDLPIASRRWDNFVLLTPAVTTDGSSGLVSYRGISGLYNQNSVDGANNNQAFFSEARGRSIGAAYVYSADSVREFQVSSGTYSAEYGQAAGGVVNSATKSGTNTMHGDLFYYLRYPALNALDPFTKANLLAAGKVPTQPIHQQQQFGGSASGPIKKDKLFGFITYDGFRKVFPITYTSTQKFPLPWHSAENYMAGNPSLSRSMKILTAPMMCSAISGVKSALGTIARRFAA